MSKKPGGDKAFARQIAELNKKAMAQEHVVSLDQYRTAAKHVDPNTILIIDDEPVMRNAIKRIFEKDQFTVLAARDAMEFSKIIEETIPDLVLLDIGLPWVSGYELCELLKSHPILKEVPVVVISGNKAEEDIRKGFEYGADEYITKPFEVDDLYTTVKKLLEQKTRA